MRQSPVDHPGLTSGQAKSKQRVALDKQLQAEDARWEKQKEKLELLYAGREDSRLARAESPVPVGYYLRRCRIHRPGMCLSRTSSKTVNYVM
jgi:hypothetical protein